jgi:hypothetical protein
MLALFAIFCFSFKLECLMPFKRFGDRKEPFVGLVRIFPFIGSICWQKPSFLDESVLGFNNFVLAKN